MKIEEFKIGTRFITTAGLTFVCTDVGSRVVVALPTEPNIARNGQVARLSERDAIDQGWFIGPPYAVAEIVFDENDLPQCSIDGGQP